MAVSKKIAMTMAAAGLNSEQALAGPGCSCCHNESNANDTSEVNNAESEVQEVNSESVTPQESSESVENAEGFPLGLGENMDIEKLLKDLGMDSGDMGDLLKNLKAEMPESTEHEAKKESDTESTDVESNAESTESVSATETTNSDSEIDYDNLDLETIRNMSEEEKDKLDVEKLTDAQKDAMIPVGAKECVDISYQAVKALVHSVSVIAQSLESSTHPELRDFSKVKSKAEATEKSDSEDAPDDSKSLTQEEINSLSAAQLPIPKKTIAMISQAGQVILNAWESTSDMPQEVRQSETNFQKQLVVSVIRRAMQGEEELARVMEQLKVQVEAKSDEEKKALEEAETTVPEVNPSIAKPTNGNTESPYPIHHLLKVLAEKAEVHITELNKSWIQMVEPEDRHLCGAAAMLCSETINMCEKWSIGEAVALDEEKEREIEEQKELMRKAEMEEEKQRLAEEDKELDAMDEEEVEETKTEL